MSVEHVWVGATTDTSAWVRGKVTGSSTRLAVDTDPALTSPVFFGPDTPTADGMVSLTATGLTANTRYYYALEDDSVLDTDFTGTFLTHPVAVGERASYIFGAAGDAGLTGAGDDSHITSQVSDNPVFDTMRAQAAADSWLFFSHLGDLHYRDITTADASLYRAAYDDNLTFNGTLAQDARQGRFYRDVSLTYVWDDHDFGPNNSDRTAAGNADANAVYRERVPHYTLPDSAGIHQSWQVGRVLYIASDVRSYRDPNADPQAPSKTLLGSAQRAWMEALLSTARDSSGAQALVWQTPSRWIGGTDTWSSFLHERDEMVQLLGDTGWLERMILLTADEHALGISSGPNNPHGYFPMYMLASMDSSFSTGTDGNEPIYNIGRRGGRQQYGTMRVQDDGHTIALTGTGYRDGTALMSHTKYVHVGSPPVALDYSLAHITEPFEPEDDDQRTRNQVTAKREGGGEFTYTLAEGPKSVQAPPDGAGEYDGSVTLNVATDAQLPDQAAWRARLGTVDEERYPAITVDLRGNPDLAAALAGLHLGDRVTIEHPPDELPPDTIGQIAEGGTTRLSVERWQAEINASPGSPYTVARTLGSSLVLEDFEDATLTVSIADGGDAAWARDNTEAHTGSWSLKSGAISDGQTSDAILTVPTRATRLRVRYKVSSEEAFDFFRILVDGTEVLAASGEVDWTTATFTVTGAAQVTFRYAKDAGLSEGSDAAWIDDLAITVLDDPGTSQPNRADTSGSQLAAAVDDDDTELIVHTPPDGIHDRKTWIISNGPSDAPNLRPLHFPFDLRLGGETVRATAAEPLAWDQFGRVETDTWGDADSGHTWSEAAGDPTDRSVDGSEGIITLQSPPNVIRFQRILETLTDCEILVAITPDQVATGAAFLPAVLLRASGSDYYRCRLVLGTDQSVGMEVTRVSTVVGATASTPFTYAAGTRLWLRVRIIGQRVLGRVWPDTAESEPQIWHIDRTVTTDPIDSGNVGITCSAFGSNTNTDPAIAYDDFRIHTPQRITATRSINTVTTDHDAGTAVSLAQPARLAL